MIKTAHHSQRQMTEIVGFLIDKVEVTKAGKTIQHTPIVIENPRASQIIDFKIRYGSTYAYSIRTVARFTLPGIDTDSGDIATMQILVSSKPSSVANVNASEDIAPPPPTNLNFTWNYESEKLLIHWAFPPNAQRDIKKFQVFRRKDVNHPFELIKMYDFDDSTVKHENLENPDLRLVENITSPASFFIDDDFDKNTYTSVNKSLIYSVSCIDAHGLTSNYSAQFAVWFDVFKNKLRKKLISHTGAPKPYPNLYLETDTFVDTIRVNGPSSKRMKLYFNPEYYQLLDDDERITRVIETKQTRGEYKIQFINLDNQKSQVLTVVIDDRRKQGGKRTASSRQTFGTNRRLTPVRK